MCAASSRIDRYLATRVHHRVPRPAAAVRIVAGLLFVLFALPKFTDHTRWVSDVGSYGLPASSLLVYAIGTVEMLGGIALVLALAVRVVAAGLAAVMTGAVLLGGMVGGNPLSFTLAPLLLFSALFVVWSTWPATRRAATAS